MSKLVNYSRHSESLNIRKNSEIDDIFLQLQRFVDFPTYFKDSLCLVYLTNLGAKGVQRSVGLQTFFQKHFVVYEPWTVKNSFITYVCYVVYVLFWTVLYMHTKISCYAWENVLKISYFLRLWIMIVTYILSEVEKFSLRSTWAK